MLGRIHFEALGVEIFPALINKKFEKNQLSITKANKKLCILLYQI